MQSNDFYGNTYISIGQSLEFIGEYEITLFI